MSLSVGDTGIFSTVEISIPRVNYTITAINTISNLISLSINVFKIAYEIYGLSETVYLNHTGEIQIFTLKDELGVSIFVPEPYLSVVSENGYIAYADRALVVNLGSWPEKEFNSLQATVTSLVVQRLGVVPTMKVTPITRERLVLIEDHDYITFRRKAKQAKWIDPKTLLKQAYEDLEKANRQISSYQRYITHYLKHCNKRCAEVIEPSPVLDCMGLIQKTFNIMCPCFPRNYPERTLPRPPVPRVERYKCGGLIESTFKKCGICISPYTKYRCKDKIRFHPIGAPITRNVVKCQTAVKIPFYHSFKICPKSYHSAYNYGNACGPRLRMRPADDAPVNLYVPCQPIALVPFTSSMKICPVSYHSKYNKRCK